MGCHWRKTIPASAVNQSLLNQSLVTRAWTRVNQNQDQSKPERRPPCRRLCPLHDSPQSGTFRDRPAAKISQSNETRHSQIGVKDVFGTWNWDVCLRKEARMQFGALTGHGGKIERGSWQSVLHRLGGRSERASLGVESSELSRPCQTLLQPGSICLREHGPLYIADVFNSSTKSSLQTGPTIPRELFKPEAFVLKPEQWVSKLPMGSTCPQNHNCRNSIGSKFIDDVLNCCFVQLEKLEKAPGMAGY